MNKLILKEIKIIKAGELLHHAETNIIRIKIEEESTIIGNAMSLSAQYTTTLYEGTNDYKICKELIDTEDRKLALLNINHKSIGISVVARKILGI